MCGPVAPASLQAVEQAPIGEPRESLRGHRGAGDVAAQALQPLAIPRRNGDARMQAEAAAGHAVGSAGFLSHFLRVDPVAAA